MRSEAAIRLGAEHCGHCGLVGPMPAEIVGMKTYGDSTELFCSATCAINKLRRIYTSGTAKLRGEGFPTSKRILALKSSTDGQMLVWPQGLTLLEKEKR
jgi:hypothetical protein